MYYARVECETGRKKGDNMVRYKSAYVPQPLPRLLLVLYAKRIEYIPTYLLVELEKSVTVTHIIFLLGLFFMIM